MAEYYFALTDINNAINRLIHACPTTFYNGLQAARNIFSKDLAADVAPVRHGRWRLYSPLTDSYECDKCGYQVIDESFRTNYCPNCGAKMDAEVTE